MDWVLCSHAGIVDLFLAPMYQVKYKIYDIFIGVLKKRNLLSVLR